MNIAKIIADAGIERPTSWDDLGSSAKDVWEDRQIAALSKRVACPNCRASPQERCTQPTDTGRRSVRWTHLARQESLAA